VTKIDEHAGCNAHAILSCGEHMGEGLGVTPSFQSCMGGHCGKRLEKEDQVLGAVPSDSLHMPC